MSAGNPNSTPRNGRIFLKIGIVLTICAAFALAWWQQSEMDRRMRHELLEKALTAERALSPESVAALKGDASDLESPNYQRIKNYLARTRTLYPNVRFLYLLRKLPDGRIIFLVDSEPAESPDYSPPGMVYESASPTMHRTFETLEPVTSGPLPDQWGVWVSALAPVAGLKSSECPVILGLDVDAVIWKAQCHASLWQLILIVAGLLLLASVSFFQLESFLRRKNDLHDAPWWHPEVHLIALGGLLATITLAWVRHDTQRAGIRAEFSDTALRQARLLQMNLQHVSALHLEGLARLFMSSDFVDRDEFSTYTAFLCSRVSALAWLWIPQVSGEKLEQFELAVQGNSSTKFRIWEGATGGKRPARNRLWHYPVCYIAPTNLDNSALGFDHASETTRMSGIQEAIRSRLPSTTDAITPIPYPATTNVMLIYRPVFARSDSNTLSGLVAVAFVPEALITQAVETESQRSIPWTLTDFFQLDSSLEKAIHLASSAGQATSHPLLQEMIAREPSAVFSPILSFDKVYAIAARPSAEFLASHPLDEGPLTLLLGLLLTSLSTLLVGLLSTRQVNLERLIADRTAALRQSESSYRGLFNSIKQAIYIQDMTTRFVDVNQGAALMYGYTREEMIGKMPDFLGAPGRNDLNVIGPLMEKAAKGEPQHIEFWGQRKNGEIFPKEVWLYPGTYFGKEVIVAIATDISERRRAEEEKARIQEHLQQSRKLESIGRLAGGVAHDFNNMLQAILGNASLALEQASDPALVRECLEEVILAGKRSADLTHQLLAFASRQSAYPRVLDVNQTIEAMLKLLRRLIGETIVLEWNPGTELWPIKMDPAQLDQILTNLATNARDAIGSGIAGTISIRTEKMAFTDAGSCKNMPGCQPGEYVMLIVRDNGRGMDEETRQHIFEPFFTTKEVGKGVGLGLATVFGIINQNHGFIHVASEPGKGTTFTIGLQRTHESLASGNVIATKVDDLAGNETILLVEDESAVLRYTAAALAKLGYTILSAETSVSAIELARQHGSKIDLLVTDVVLPDMNGRELTQTLVSISPGLPCLFMSGYTADIIAQQGVVDQGLHFIQKPFQIENLARKIRTILDNKR